MNVRPLLDFIARYESNGDYGVVFGGARPKPPAAVDRLTVAEVRAWQDRAIAAGSASSAAGRYQIIRKTLDSLIAQMGLTGSEIFDAGLQDRMAIRLLEVRGLRLFADGHITLDAFGTRVAQEWASMPVLTNMRGAHRQLRVGDSYYAGDGLNAAHAPVAGFRAALSAVRTTTPAAPPAPASAPPVAAVPAAGAGAAALTVLPWEAVALVVGLGLVVAAAIILMRKRT